MKRKKDWTNVLIIAALACMLFAGFTTYFTVYHIVPVVAQSGSVQTDVDNYRDNSNAIVGGFTGAAACFVAVCFVATVLAKINWCNTARSAEAAYDKCIKQCAVVVLIFAVTGVFMQCSIALAFSKNIKQSVNKTKFEGTVGDKIVNNCKQTAEVVEAHKLCEWIQNHLDYKLVCFCVTRAIAFDRPAVAIVVYENSLNKEGKND